MPSHILRCVVTSSFSTLLSDLSLPHRHKYWGLSVMLLFHWPFGDRQLPWSLLRSRQELWLYWPLHRRSPAKKPWAAKRRNHFITANHSESPNRVLFRSSSVNQMLSQLGCDPFLYIPGVSQVILCQIYSPFLHCLTEPWYSKPQ